jgi:hypothetical protein
MDRKPGPSEASRDLFLHSNRGIDKVIVTDTFSDSRLSMVDFCRPPLSIKGMSSQIGKLVIH